MNDRADRDPLADMLDRVAVFDLTVDYCTALDTKDWDALRSVFVPEATARLGRTDHEGVDDIIGRCRSALSSLDASQHMITNHRIRVAGDRATSSCYVQAQHVRADASDGPNYLVGGRYDDELRRTADGWRIVRRVLTVLWTEGNRDVPRRDERT
jgi:3-phenylpropionate/cinnamic acid dioxygenase small subunit